MGVGVGVGGCHCDSVREGHQKRVQRFGGSAHLLQRRVCCSHAHWVRVAGCGQACSSPGWAVRRSGGEEGGTEGACSVGATLDQWGGRGQAFPGLGRGWGRVHEAQRDFGRCCGGCSSHMTQSYDDGHVIQRYDDGHVIQRFDDGHVIQRFGDGHVIQSYDDGHVTLSDDDHVTLIGDDLTSYGLESQSPGDDLGLWSGCHRTQTGCAATQSPGEDLGSGDHVILGGDHVTQGGDHVTQGGDHVTQGGDHALLSGRMIQNGYVPQKGRKTQSALVTQSVT